MSKGRIVRLAIAHAVFLLPALTAPYAASAADSEWVLSTKNAEIEIGLRNDADAILALHAVDRAWEWVQTPNIQKLPESVTQDGVVRHLHWIYSGASESADHRLLTLSFRNASPALELRSYWKSAADLGPVEHWRVLKNDSGAPITLKAQPSLSLESIALPHGHYVESTQVRRGGANAQVSGGVLTRPVGQYWSVMVPSRPSDGGGGTGEDASSQVPFLNFQVDS